MASVPQHKPYGVVYLIHNTITHAVYVGLSTRPRYRWTWHQCELNANRHPNSHLQHAWNKYQAAAFEFAVVESCATAAELSEAEIFWIEYLRSCGVPLYNQKSGGGFGGKLSDALRQKLSEAHKGIGNSPATRQKISQNTRGIRKTRTAALEAKWEAQRGPEHPDRTRQRIAGMVAKRPIFVFRSPDGTLYETQNIEAFAREHGLHGRLLHYVVSGKQHHHRGWVLVSRKEASGD